MKRLGAILPLLCATILHAGVVIESILTTPEDLLAKGVSIQKTLTTEAGVPTYTIALTIGSDFGDCFRWSELVVLKSSTSAESLPLLDRARAEKEPARIVRCSEKVASFTLFGKEHERAYLAIECVLDGERMAIHRRYLLPTTAINETTPRRSENKTTAPSEPQQRGRGLTPERR